MNHILLRAYDSCQVRKASITRKRRRGVLGVAIETDGQAREWQRLDRIAAKCRRRIIAKLTAAEALATACETVLDEDKLKQFGFEVVNYSREPVINLFEQNFPEIRAALRQYREVANA